MRLAPHRLLEVALAGLVLLAGAAPATAQDPLNGRIVKLDAERGEITVVFETTVRDAGSAIDLDSVRVRLDGEELSASAERLTKESGASIDRQALLVLDTSSSMLRDGRLAAAKQAAEAFIDKLPEDVEVGLITFDKTARTLVRPTLNHDEVLSALQELKASGGTAIFDAVLLAVGTQPTAGVRNVILLTDDAIDQSSKATLEETTAQLRESQVGLDAVTFSDVTDLAVLNELTAAANGELVRATEVEELRGLFEQSAQTIAEQLLLTATVPAGAQPGEPTVAVEVQAGDKTLRDEALLILDAEDLPLAAPAIVPVNTGEGVFASQTMLIAAAILLFLGLSIMMTYALSAAAENRREAEVRRRLAHYSLANVRATDITLPGVNLDDESAVDRVSTASSSGSLRSTTILGESGLARTAIGLAERVVATRDSEGRLAARLESAAIPLRAAEWLVLHAAAVVLPALLLLLISGGDVALALLGMLIGAVGPYVYLSFKRSGRKHKFEEQLPGTLQLLAGSLSAGYSLPQAVDTVARESAQPVAGEFGRAIMESRLAVPVEDALGHVAERTGSQDFGWVVMAIRIQRQVGGNLAELLTTIAGTLRERDRLRRQVRVLAAEGRMSAWILGLLPLIFTVYLFVVRRDYLLKLFSEPLGIAMVIGGVIALVVGLFWMKKIVDVEV